MTTLLLDHVARAFGIWRLAFGVVPPPTLRHLASWDYLTINMSCFPLAPFCSPSPRPAGPSLINPYRWASFGLSSANKAGDRRPASRVAPSRGRVWVAQESAEARIRGVRSEWAMPTNLARSPFLSAAFSGGLLGAVGQDTNRQHDASQPEPRTQAEAPSPSQPSMGERARARGAGAMRCAVPRWAASRPED